MAKDFKRSKKPQRSRRGTSPWLLVFAAFFCGYLSGSVLDVSQLGGWLNARIAQVQQNKTEPQTLATQAKLPKPKFEFYTLLTQNETTPSVQSPKAALLHPPAAPSVTAKRPLAQQKKIKANFVVQLASFHQKKDAEQMKAELILKGFSATIESINRQNRQWYRVVMGPFSDRIEAEKAQVAVARSAHTMGLVRKMNA